MKIVIGGDICITSSALEHLERHGVSSFNELVSLNQGADISIFNMECPATNSDEKILKIGPNHKTNILAVDYIRQLGFTHASVANNHIWDFGKEGFVDTINTLSKEGISVIGISKEKNVVTQNTNSGLRVGVISFADDEFYGNEEVYRSINVFDPLESFDLVRETKQKCDYMIVLFHGGMENYRYPTPYLRRVCRKFIECGADFVTCQHSHCVGCEEVYNGKHILYGQGNTYFYRKENTSNKWNCSILVVINIDSEPDLKYEFIKTREDGGIEQIPKIDDEIASFLKRSKDIVNEDFVEKNFRKQCIDIKKTSNMMCFLTGKGIVSNFLNRITNGAFFRILFPNKKSIAMINMIRCSVHREVLEEIFNAKHYCGKKERR